MIYKSFEEIDPFLTHYDFKILPLLFCDSEKIKYLWGGGGNKWSGNYNQYKKSLRSGDFGESRYQTKSFYSYHFTKLESLMKILESRTLRFSNISRSNDKLEMKYYLNKFYPQNDEILFNQLTQNTFVFSTSNESIIDSEHELTMWKEYGGRQTGVIIGLEMICNGNHKNYFSHVNVAYELRDYLLFKRANMEFTMKNSIEIDYSQCLFLPSIMHKTKGSSVEREVRTIYLPNFTNTSMVEPNANILSFIKEENENKYLEVPLNIESQFLPKINIVKIILGRKLENESASLIKELNTLFLRMLEAKEIKHYPLIEMSQCEDLINY